MNKKANELAIHSSDTGSSEIQIALLTEKIETLSKHIKQFKKDKHSTLGLTKSVNKRKKLLTYLKKKNVESYQKDIKQFKKDKHSSVGLLRAVNRRKKLLEYLKKNKMDSYKNVLSKLNLRK